MFDLNTPLVDNIFNYCYILCLTRVMLAFERECKATNCMIRDYSVMCLIALCQTRKITVCGNRGRDQRERKRDEHVHSYIERERE